MQDLTHSLDRLTGQRLLVVGDLMLDRYVWGEAERVSPEAPVLVLTEDQDEVRPGGAANVASTADKRVTLEQAVTLVAAHRRARRSIVFTNGCFDLLHVGHITLLEEASRHGDVLIVAINSDASVRALKGDERPVIGQNDRARMLAALACIDHVLIFADDTPHRLLEALRPDVLVKGGTTGHIVGRELVEAYGGRIVQTSTVPGLSTTSLLSRLQAATPATVPEETP